MSRCRPSNPTPENVLQFLLSSSLCFKATSRSFSGYEPCRPYYPTTGWKPEGIAMKISAQTALIDARIDRQLKPYVRTHGVSHTAEYRAWQTMRRRCYEPSDQAYPDYGGRGITVCDRWLESPLNFIEDMGLKPSPAHTLDREENSLGYFKDNCRWVTHKVNNQNRRSNRLITYLGRTQPLICWIRELGLNESLVTNRLHSQWPIERVFTEPKQVLSPARFCVGCGKRCRGQLRCQPCENRDRPKRKKENQHEIPPDQSLHQP